MTARRRSLNNLLDCNFIVKWKYMHSVNCAVCISIDSTTLADGDYQMIPEPEGDISEAPGNVIGDLTEAPNLGSETFSVDIFDPSPTSEGKP
jgi:hypothetical protein